MASILRAGAGLGIGRRAALSLRPPTYAWIDALTDYRDRLGFDSFVFWPIAGDRLAQTKTFFEEVRPHLG
jgi:hypothetical protein